MAGSSGGTGHPVRRTPRRARAYVAPAMAAVVALSACGGDGTAPPEVIPAELAATWTAEPACLPNCGFTLESVADPADSINVTAFTGLATDVILTRDGTFRLRTRPGPDTASVASARVAGSLLIVTDAAGQVDTLDYTVAGQTLEVRFRRTFAVFDFTGDGTADPAWARGTFLRR